MEEFRVAVPNRPGELRELLEYLAEKGINLKSVASVPVDEPGQLAKVAQIVAAAGANIESFYLLGKVGQGKGSRVQFGLRFDDLERARAALRASEEWAPWVGIGGEG